VVCHYFTGKDSVFKTALIADYNSKTSATVLSLVEPLLNRGHTLLMGNFYNAPAQAQKLKSPKTDCIGTLCLNRKDMPKMAKDKNQRKGS
jgi:hypothetical protein